MPPQPSETTKALTNLVQLVARAFYEPRFIVVLDQLARLPVIKDDELSGRTGMPLKELTQVTTILINHKLIQVYRQNELKSERAQRAVARSYYWIDYQNFCNVVKWRIYAVRRVIHDKMRNDMDNKGYICSQCQKSFSPLDVGGLYDPLTGAFACDVCGGECIDNENAENVLGSKDRMQRFNTQTAHIVDGLRKVESVVLPSFDVAEWVRKHLLTAVPDGEPVDDGLRIAGANGTGKAQLTRVSVIMEDDKTDEALRREREKKADAKRQQNALPEWHLQSTVSGHLTTLGLKNEAQNAQYSLATTEQIPIDRKPFAQGEIDLDAYYSSLGPAKEPGSDQSTPLTSSRSSSLLGKRDRHDADETEDELRVSKAPKTGASNTVDEAKNPIVYVAGEARRFLDITDDEHDKMTTEEYEAYAELMVQLS